MPISRKISRWAFPSKVLRIQKLNTYGSLNIKETVKTRAIRHTLWFLLVVYNHNRSLIGSSLMEKGRPGYISWNTLKIYYQSMLYVLFLRGSCITAVAVVIMCIKYTYFFIFKMINRAVASLTNDSSHFYNPFLYIVCMKRLM